MGYKYRRNYTLENWKKLLSWKKKKLFYIPEVRDIIRWCRYRKKLLYRYVIRRRHRKFILRRLYFYWRILFKSRYTCPPQNLFDCNSERKQLIYLLDLYNEWLPWEHVDVYNTVYTRRIATYLKHNVLNKYSNVSTDIYFDHFLNKFNGKDRVLLEPYDEKLKELLFYTWVRSYRKPYHMDAERLLLNTVAIETINSQWDDVYYDEDLKNILVNFKEPVNKTNVLLFDICSYIEDYEYVDNIWAYTKMYPMCIYTHKSEVKQLPASRVYRLAQVSMVSVYFLDDTFFPTSNLFFINISIDSNVHNLYTYTVRIKTHTYILDEPIIERIVWRYKEARDEQVIYETVKIYYAVKYYEKFKFIKKKNMYKAPVDIIPKQTIVLQNYKSLIQSLYKVSKLVHTPLSSSLYSNSHIFNNYVPLAYCKIRLSKLKVAYKYRRWSFRLVSTNIKIFCIARQVNWIVRKFHFFINLKTLGILYTHTNLMLEGFYNSYYNICRKVYTISSYIRYKYRKSRRIRTKPIYHVLNPRPVKYLEWCDLSKVEKQKMLEKLEKAKSKVVEESFSVDYNYSFFIPRVKYSSSKKSIYYINFKNINIQEQTPTISLFSNSFLTKYFFKRYIFNFYNSIKVTESKQIKKIKKKKKVYALNFWKKKLKVYKAARTVHWNLYTNKTLKARRYSNFLKPFLKKQTLLNEFLLEYFAVRFKFSVSFWQSFTELNLVYFSTNIVVKSIYQFPVSYLFWLYLARIQSKKNKIKLRIKHWAKKMRRVRDSFWMDSRRNVPNFFFKQIIFKKNNFSSIQFDFRTNYICILKNIKNFKNKNQIIYDNKMLKLHDMRYRP